MGAYERSGGRQDPFLWQWISDNGNVVVSVYDMWGHIDMRYHNFQVDFGENDTVRYIRFGGAHAMGGLGITIAGATSVGSIVDGRSGARRGDLSFIASDSSVNYVYAATRVAGYELNGLVLGGLWFPGDMERDGVLDDATALYVYGDLGASVFGRGTR